MRCNPICKFHKISNRQLLGTLCKEGMLLTSEISEDGLQ